MRKIFQAYFYMKPMTHLKANLANERWMVLNEMCGFFCVNLKSKMAAIRECGCIIGEYIWGNEKKFGETRNLIEHKLNMNNHWMVLYHFFCVDSINDTSMLIGQKKL